MSFLLWSKTHAQAGQVSITEGKEDHEDDEPAVMVEENWQVETRLNIAQHEEGHKDHTTRNDHRKQETVLTRLKETTVWSQLEPDPGGTPRLDV